MSKHHLKKIRIFIAGHRGMVGSALVRHFKKNNIDNLILATKKKLDLLDEQKVIKFIKKEKPHVIINCAGKVGGILANSSYPVEFLNKNIMIQLNLINAAFKNKIEHFINLGSSCIYPKKSKQPIKEDYLLSNYLEKTNEAYALAKIVGLKSCEFYNQQFNKSYFTLMPCNLYGPNDNFDLKNSHFIPALIKKIVNSPSGKNSKIEIWGTGKAKREVMYVDDLARAIHFILEKKISKNKKLLNIIKRNPVINVGSESEFTIKEFAKIICKINNKKDNLIFNKEYPDGTMRKILDNKVIKSLGWKPKISLEQGLLKTIEWYKENYL
tara:strand:- start:10865 stop:11839 length:975 start_codon:yes stop_codon:yes gene_type:complete